MNLDQLTANIRLRNVWEAIDLGFVMVRQWWKSIYIPLAVLTFSIALPLFYFVQEDDYWLAVLIFWWLKPLYDRLVLHIISHKLFNDELSSWQALKSLPYLIWNSGFFQTLTFRRFSLSRGFNLPIWQLEQLRGPARANRQRVLHLATHSQAVWLTLCVWLLELIFMGSLFALLLLFLPSQMATDFLDGLFNRNIEYQEWIKHLNMAFYVVVVTALHPFYIAGNFSLYINRRTQLEAWDIELDFRKMAQRLQQLSHNPNHTIKHNVMPAVAFTISLLMWLGTQSPVLAAANSEQKNITPSPTQTSEYLAPERLPASRSKQVIKEVMLDKNLDDKKVVKRWVLKNKTKKKKEQKQNLNFLEKLFQPFSKLLAVLLEFTLWIAIAIGLVLLFYYRDRWLHLLQGSRKVEDDYQPPEIMFGMDLRPDSLPDDIIAEAQKFWQNGKHRESLSLLYRGALVHLINHEKIQLEASHTEGDIIKLSSRTLKNHKLAYLKLLTQQWQTIAYAHRLPDSNEMQNLFDSWTSEFVSKAKSAEPGKAT